MEAVKDAKIEPPFRIALDGPHWGCGPRTETFWGSCSCFPHYNGRLNSSPQIPKSRRQRDLSKITGLAGAGPEAGILLKFA